MDQLPDRVLISFGLNPNASISKIGSGHINRTYKIEGEPSFILQRINISVFKHPEIIASNIRLAADHLRKRYPQIVFMANIKTRDGHEMAMDEESYPWRLYPLIDHTVTVDQLETETQAFSAAREFGRLGRYLSSCEVTRFKPTIDKFQDLSWRFAQFEEALHHATRDRLDLASDPVQLAKKFAFLVRQYQDLIKSGSLPLRITHNDTKINNILFDAITGAAICAIDLDTLMPGYFIYDLGDMVRTFVSPVSEEEKDVGKIEFRKSFYDAVVNGYLSQMGEALTEREKQAIPFAGLMMTYIMALRFLADFLNGDIYYHTTYPGQNLVRAKNQLRLLDILHQHLTK